MRFRENAEPAGIELAPPNQALRNRSAITIPPRSKQLIWTRCDKPAALRSGLYATERADITIHGLYIANMLASHEHPSNDFPLEVMNTTYTSITVPKNTVLAHLAPAEYTAPVMLASPHPSAASQPPPSQIVPLGHLPPEDRKRFAALLDSYADVFGKGRTTLGKSPDVEHDIYTSPGPPVIAPNYQVPVHYRDDLEK